MYKAPAFTTPRLLFEPMTLSDLDDMHEIRNKPEVMKWSMRKTPDQSLAETKTWLTNFVSGESQPPRLCYVIRELSSSGTKGRVIGNMGVRMEPAPAGREDPGLVASSEAAPAAVAGGIVLTPGKDRWELGYIFHPEVWGRGYASEAVQHLSARFFEYLRDAMVAVYADQAANVEPGLFAITNFDNGPSARVLVKNGFVGPVEEFVEGDGTRCVVFVKVGV
ncbi:GNAT family N-acetyltransferase [Aspergillus homomorphus CBS 101889]|uniref:Acyl-CoA N-acyltransferase n=1 Tax=Aspergillus homomorphus (strain CBS 101889) TaxID=1450537 RepID=A0A395IB10_ASPHC|nr:acyl-CoA N-acyltransferase [Aspergillus homomorphus CBS 101889]RAL16999.1 acyl-CoA N-acyltransferase [Aspergillus homomorphus CBS 101889]